MRVMRASDGLALPATLTVTARFRHAVMAEDASGALVSVLVEGRLAGPSSIVVDRLPQDDRFVVSEGAERFNVVLPRGGDRFSRETCAMMKRFLDSFAPRESLYRTAACDRSAAALLEGHARSIKGKGEPFVDVSGFGCGLTPSTDDYLLGALACCAASGLPAEIYMRTNIERSLDGMTPLSRAMLSHALDGRYPEVVLDFMRHRDARRLLAFARHGSTSGYDMVLGLYAAAQGAFC